MPRTPIIHPPKTQPGSLPIFVEFTASMWSLISGLDAINIIFGTSAECQEILNQKMAEGQILSEKFSEKILTFYSINPMLSLADHQNWLAMQIPLRILKSWYGLCLDPSPIDLKKAMQSATDADYTKG